LRLPYAIAAALCGLLCFSAPCLVVRDEAGRARAILPLPPGGSFALQFRHSVTRQPCIDRFRLGTGDRMVLVGTEFQGLGAGLPFTDEGGSVTLRDGWIVLEGLNRVFGEIRIAPLALTEHRIVVAGVEHDLLALIGGRGQARLAVERLGPAALGGHRRSR
jgi:hypothetical protein